MKKTFHIGFVTFLLFSTSVSAKDNGILESYAVKSDISPPLSVAIKTSSLPEKIKKSALLFPAYTSYQGLGADFPNYTVKSDSPYISLAVGLTQVVQWVKSDIGIFNKSTGKILNGFPIPGNSIWKGFGGLCEQMNDGYQTVKYDQLADRWIFTQLAYDDPTNGPFYQCIAISTSPDATGTYYRYAYQFESLNTQGELGLWPNAYYMSFYMQGPESLGARVCALNRENMLKGLPTSMQCRHFTELGAIQPADLDGKKLPPANSPGIFVTRITNWGGYPGISFYAFYVDFSNAKNSHFDNIKIDYNYGIGSNWTTSVSEPFNTSMPINFSYRRLAYREFNGYGSLLITNLMSYSNKNNVWWLEYQYQDGNAVPNLHQSAMYSAMDYQYHYAPSMAMDKIGNIAFGYTLSSTNFYPSILLSTHLSTDPLGQFSPPTFLVSGRGSQMSGAWSSYSSLVLDPEDDCNFWYSNQYLLSSGTKNWSTKIFNFTMPNCSA